MSSTTNIPLNNRSMNGIITLSDGAGSTIQNGSIVTNNFNTNTISSSGVSSLNGYTSCNTITPSTNNSTHLANCAFVQNALSSSLTAYAPINSPNLTGTPTCPTAPLATNTTQIASTEFVLANAGGGSLVASSNTWTNQNIFSALTIFTGNIQALTLTITPTVLSYIAGLTSNVQAQINSILSLFAPLLSPAFTGIPTCPTATVGTNTTQIASTAFVLANASTSSTFATDITVNGMTVGLGGGQVSTNTTVGFQAENATATGGLNTSIGYKANTANTSGNSNTAIGHSALSKNTVGNNNTAVGHNALFNLTGAGGTLNCALGETSLFALTTGANNVGIGYQTMRGASTASNSTAIGHNAFQTGNFSNSTAIGYSAQPTANNQVVLGTTADTVLCPNAITVTGTQTNTGLLTANGGITTTTLKYTTTDPSSVPMARFFSNNAYVGGTGGLLAFTTATVLYDTYGGCFTTANRYTVPVSGYYLINGRYDKSSITTQTQAWLDVRVNTVSSGSTLDRLFQITSTAIINLTGSNIVRANAGDWMTFYAQVGVSETPTFTVMISWLRSF